jgi:dienelactone hydrolase
MCFGDDARPPLPPAGVVGAMSAPLLLLAAGQDHLGLGARGPDLGRERLHVGHRRNRVYPDAVHSFFDRRDDEYREECDDAWRRMLDFMAGHGGPDRPYGAGSSERHA